MAGLLAASGELATASAHSSDHCPSVRPTTLTASEVPESGKGPEEDQDQDSSTVNGGNSVSEESSTPTSPPTSHSQTTASSPNSQTRTQAQTTEGGFVNASSTTKDVLSNGLSSSPTASDPAVCQDGKDRSTTLRSSVLPPRRLLSQVRGVFEDVENDGEASVGSSSAATYPSSSLPLPPVPFDMAEAIKRQQKGEGSVRYWKTKHLQSGRNQSLSLKFGNGGVQNTLLPVLKPSPFHGSGGGVVANGNASPGAGEPRLSKAKERLRQRGKENGLGEFRRSVNNYHTTINSNNNLNNGHTPMYHTHYMYGHTLGGYPPPQPAYRSVTALESLLSPPFPASFAHPLPHRLTKDSYAQLPLTDVTSPNPVLTLTQPSSKPLGRLPRGSPERDTAQADDPHTAEMVQQDQADSGTVVELTCLQLADAILGSKAPDISQYYQMCQTKIRYVDFLERSASFRAMETKAQQSSPRGQSTSVRHNTSPRLSTWTPCLDLKDSAIPPDPTPPDASGKRKGTDGGDSGSDRRSPVTFPSLVSPSGGLRMSHGLPPSAGRGYLPSALNDTQTSSSVPANPFGGVSANPTGKPILKPFNPEAIPVKVQRPYDPFSPRSVYSDLTGTSGPLSVRGTTMYPLGTEEGGGQEPREPSRRAHSSKSRKEAELRKRAVRFSISDQVYEFAPGEPLLP